VSITPNICLPRQSFKPFEYDVSGYKEAIQHSYWLVSEWSFTSDIQDYYTNISSYERGVITRALFAISQVEIAVKRFWGNIGTMFPKPEIEQVGAVFAESEVRHADAYSHLLTVLGIEDDFQESLNSPVLSNRFNYLTKKLETSMGGDIEKILLSISLFTMLVENVSLFSQFLIIKSFNKYRNVLKDIDNVVQATQQEETVHAHFGFWLIDTLSRESGTFFTPLSWVNLFLTQANQAYQAECNVVDFIFGDDDALGFLRSEDVKEFIRFRIWKSLDQMNLKATNFNNPCPENLRWFEEELQATVAIDFFSKKSTAYTKRTQSVTSNDLF
jgi:ribonucleoside-diphosphate reductase beta chain